MKLRITRNCHHKSACAVTCHVAYDVIPYPRTRTNNECANSTNFVALFVMEVCFHCIKRYLWNNVTRLAVF